MRALYFDGINSKPIEVDIQIVDEFVEIIAIDNINLTRFNWNRIEISANSFSSNSNVILSYNRSAEQIHLSGNEGKKFVDFVVSKKSLDQRLLQYITTVDSFRLVIVSILLIIGFIYGYMKYVAPYIGDEIVRIIPVAIERKAGNVIYDNLNLIIDKDSSKSKLLMDFYHSCGFQSPYDIRFDYSNSSVVNAFALPGGRIVIFEGLIKRTKCWDELAALMAHELAHVNERHSLKQISKSIVSYLIISVLTGDMAGASSVILENAHNVYELSNSRKHEKEADLIGLDYLLDAKIRPEAMADLFKRLEHSADGTTNIVMDNLRYLNTHPLNVERIEYIENEVVNLQAHEFSAEENMNAELLWIKLQDE